MLRIFIRVSLRDGIHLSEGLHHEGDTTLSANERLTGFHFRSYA
jgi:hypothetical protein